MHRILLVDDHPEVQHGVQQLLSAGVPEAHFGNALTVGEALKEVQRERWDLTVTDWGLPGGGVKFIRNLKAAEPNMSVLVYSMYPESQFGAPAIRAGAAAYVGKDRPNDVLLAAVRGLLEAAVGKGSDTPNTVRDPGGPIPDWEYRLLEAKAWGHQPPDVASEMTRLRREVIQARTEWENQVKNIEALASERRFEMPSPNDPLRIWRASQQRSLAFLEFMEALRKYRDALKQLGPPVR